jgi:hypothetical protein
MPVNFLNDVKNEGLCASFREAMQIARESEGTSDKAKIRTGAALSPVYRDRTYRQADYTSFKKAIEDQRPNCISYPTAMKRIDVFDLLERNKWKWEYVSVIGWGNLYALRHHLNKGNIAHWVGYAKQGTGKLSSEIDEVLNNEKAGQIIDMVKYETTSDRIFVKNVAAKIMVAEGLVNTGDAFVRMAKAYKF